MRRIPLLSLTFLLLSCGGESQSDYSNVARKCAVPRPGKDQQGTLDDEKRWLRAWTDDLYLWYREVPAVDPSKYTTATDYFDQLKTPVITTSGKAKDQFHFWYPTDYWESLSQSGIEPGYGITWAALQRTPPRRYLVAYVEPNSPAATNQVKRGAQLLQVDGVDFVNANDQASVDKLNAGLFPGAAGEPHQFVLQDAGSSVPRAEFSMSSANVTSTPVPTAGTPSAIIDTPTGKVGYLLFNDHIATAEKALIDAVNQLKAAAITDLVLDIRYNGGGYLAIASQLAYMIAGSGRTSGKVFERLAVNDKHASPTPTGFYNQTVGLSASAGSALPTLSLSRVFVLTGPGTCSASESVVNGLAGVNVNVIQIGATTCGKPYGFVPEDNCGTTYFSIQFQGVNEKGFGSYADGFTPGATTGAGFPGCVVSDDFGHLLGDPAEARLAMALHYRTAGTCAGAASSTALSIAGPRGDGPVLKSVWLQNRIFR
jgi:carboxyl-terminal processing protease